MKIGFEKTMGYPCSSLATKWKLQCIRPTTNTKRFRKFCVRLTHLGTNFAPISHQILHLEKKFPKVYLIRTPSVSLPTAANPALKLSKWPASRQCTNRATLYERSNHCGSRDYFRFLGLFSLSWKHRNQTWGNSWGSFQNHQFNSHSEWPSFPNEGHSLWMGVCWMRVWFECNS